MALLAPLGVAFVAVLSAYVAVSNRYFAPDACERVGVALNEYVVGQPLASKLIAEHICAHLKEKFPRKPLVLSFHGPPGVGKTYTHELTANAMYGMVGGRDTIPRSMMKTLHSAKRASQKWLPVVKAAGATSERWFGNPLKCPGSGCPGYKVIYGTDYIKGNKDMEHHTIRESILQHARAFPESVIVVEEYDKLHCETRAMMRQIINHPETANISLNKAVIVLEANTGMFPIQNLLIEAKGREGSSEHMAHRVLKDAMFAHWTKPKPLGCEGKIDVAKFLNLVDLFIPFFPLERHHVRELIVFSLVAAQASVSKGTVTWTTGFVDHYLSQVHFDGAFAVDGAIDVKSVSKRVDDLLTKAEKTFEAEECLASALQYLLNTEQGYPDVRIVCMAEMIA